MGVQRASWPIRFFRWFFRAPFQKLPPQYGNTVPPDLQQFEAEAEEARRQSVGSVARPMSVHHAKTQPARADSSLERQ